MIGLHCLGLRGVPWGIGSDLAHQLCLEMICVTSILEHLSVVALPCGNLTSVVVRDVVAPLTWNLCEFKEQSAFNQPTIWLDYSKSGKSSE